MAHLLDGKIVAQKIREQVAADTLDFKQKGHPVTLAIVAANDQPASLSYVESIQKAAEKVGIKIHLEKPSDINQANLEMIVGNLAQDTSIDGIMLQTPLPSHIDAAKLSSLISPRKDVDGLNPLSAGYLCQGLDCFAPATAQAVMEILYHYEIVLEGKNIVVVGRSNVIGKPVAQLLLKQNATVTVCHSKTKDIGQFIRSCDILVAAVGRSKLITADYVNKDLIVVDVGTNFDSSGKMTGDVDFENVEPIVQAITPVPGGVGPVTTAVLLKHVCESVKNNL